MLNNRDRLLEIDLQTMTRSPPHPITIYVYLQGINQIVYNTTSQCNLGSHNLLYFSSYEAIGQPLCDPNHCIDQIFRKTSEKSRVLRYYYAEICNNNNEESTTATKVKTQQHFSKQNNSENTTAIKKIKQHFIKIKH